MARIDAFLKLGVAQGCSDLHLAVGVPPMLRMHGDLMPIKFRDLGEAELEGYITEVLNPSQIKVLREGNDLDFSYVSAEGGRFRVNVFRKETGIGAAFRAIPTQMPSIDQLGLPPIVRKLCDYHQGMILVTGSTGTGKTTTLGGDDRLPQLDAQPSTSSAWKTRSNSSIAASRARSSSASSARTCRRSRRACARRCARIRM